MSLSCYLSRNARQYLQKARENTAREDNQLFLNIIEANLFRRILRIAGRNLILISSHIIQNDSTTMYNLRRYSLS